jgi:uncharacterized protein Usg
MIIKQTVTTEILYYRPDHNWLLQAFVWQCRDVVPELPRIHKFLNHWHNEIDAVISQVNVAYCSNETGYRNIKWQL